MNRFSGSLPIVIASVIASVGLLGAGLSSVTQVDDQGENGVHPKSLSTDKLAALHVYQLTLPAPPRGSFDPAAAERGEALFNGKADCSRCHVPPLYTEPGWNMHLPEEIGIDSFQADRSPDERYRTAPLKGLWTHSTGGFYHDGRFATLGEVVDHYDRFLALGLTAAERDDLVQFLNSL
jgi:cytochrome c peroxidase